jgi:LCP family protein required for cell wall assembly
MTTTEPLVRVAVEGDASASLSAAIADFYSAAVDDRSQIASAPEGLVAMAATANQSGATARSVRVIESEMANGDIIAVIHSTAAGSSTEDLLFAADTGGGWQLLAGQFAGGAVWLGDERLAFMAIGSDARPGQNQERLRADSLHVITLAPDGSGGAIVGFPRDTLIDQELMAAAAARIDFPESQLPGTSRKFTLLMANRGPAFIRATAEEMTGMSLEGHVLVGFKGFDGLVRSLGKVPIDLPKYVNCSVECDHDFRPGPQTLNADEALDLARARKGVPGGDLGRSFNQGLIIIAAMDMVQNMDVDLLPTLLAVLLEHGFTDMATDRLLTLGAAAFLTDSETMENLVIPGRLGWYGKASVVYVDEEELAAVAADVDADGLLDGIPAPEPESEESSDDG